MFDHVGPPVLKLTLAFKAQTVQLLWLNVVPFEELKDTSEEVFLVARILVKAASHSIEKLVMQLGCLLQVSD